ncbi:MAG: cytochrome c-type biogenesis protein CcmH [bacterium]
MRKFILSTAFLYTFFLLPAYGTAQQFIPSTDHQHTVSADSLSTDQYARAGRLAGQLMAPCCYSKTAAEDQSGAAQSVKMEVRRGILEGHSDDEILSGCARVYGERILAQPKAVGFNKMAWIMPIVALLVGALVYVGFIRRTSSKPQESKEKISSKMKTSVENDPYLQRLEQELDDFES